jgi:P27 family predicted phage terminase small subunit
MGKRGPKPTPTIALRNRGSWRGSARKNEPKLPVEAPDAPSWLKGEAKKAWEELVPILMDAGVLTKADKMALAGLCRYWADWLEAQRKVEKDGITVMGALGGLKPHPAIAIANAAWANVVKGCAMFGIDPADRSNVKAAPKAEPEDAKKRFFKGGA